MSQPQRNDWISVAEAVEILRDAYPTFGKSTFYRWRDKGRFPSCHNLGERMTQVRRHEVEALLPRSPRGECAS